MSFTWNGRQLEVVKYGDDEVLYTYNSEGIRTSKTVNGITTTYQLEGAKIISETTSDTTIWYIYDENGMIIGFEYLDEAYYFEKNAQGDVLRIFDETGKVISEYVYDAWGNVVKTIGDEDIAKVNPFRYRGYYQDNETGFYYLQSRYYDSETGRFLNADIKFTDKNNILGNNLYTYCYNNSVNMLDYDGREPMTIAIIYFAAGVVLAILAFAIVITPAFQRAWNNTCDALIGAIEVSFDMMIGITTVEAKRLSNRAKSIYNGVCSSLARAKSLKYKHSTENHHIVAKRAHNAKYARAILDIVGIDYNSEKNLVRIKTGLHRRLHTDVYYGWANSVVIKAYNLAGGSYEKKYLNVSNALKTLKGFIRTMDSLVSY